MSINKKVKVTQEYLNDILDYDAELERKVQDLNDRIREKDALIDRVYGLLEAHQFICEAFPVELEALAERDSYTAEDVLGIITRIFKLAALFHRPEANNDSQD